MIIYTGVLVYIAAKKELPERWPVATHLLLAPAYLFLLLHLVILFANLVTLFTR